MRQRRAKSAMLVGLEEMENTPDPKAGAAEADQRQVLERLWKLIQRLKPLERQVMLSYLEGLDAAAIAEVTGISAANVATKVHRIKRILAQQFQEGK